MNNKLCNSNTWIFIDIGMKTLNYSPYTDQYVAYKEQTDEIYLLVSVFSVQSLASEFNQNFDSLLL
jgi:hypothetical protein